jgi:hypothetical protein
MRRRALASRGAARRWPSSYRVAAVMDVLLQLSQTVREILVGASANEQITCGECGTNVGLKNQGATACLP